MESDWQAQSPHPRTLQLFGLSETQAPPTTLPQNTPEYLMIFFVKDYRISKDSLPEMSHDSRWHLQPSSLHLYFMARELEICLQIQLLLLRDRLICRHHDSSRYHKRGVPFLVSSFLQTSVPFSSVVSLHTDVVDDFMKLVELIIETDSFFCLIFYC